jgi:hypothetical protein
MKPKSKFFSISRFFQGSTTQSIPGQSQNPSITFSRLIAEWFSVNYWESRHFAILTRGCCPPSGSLSVREVDHLLKGCDHELKPKYFIALANVYKYLGGLNTKNIYAFHDIYGLFAALPTASVGAAQASWWFALYLGEEGMIDQFRRFEAPSLGLGAIGSYLPVFVRKNISKHGYDPVSFLEERNNRLSASYMPSVCRAYGDWILGYKSATMEETRILLTLSISFLADIDCDYSVFSDLVSELVASRKPLALKPSQGGGDLERVVAEG